MVLPIPASAQQAGNGLKVTFDFEIVRPDPDRGKRIAITLAGSAPHVIEIPPYAPTPRGDTWEIPARALGREPYVVVAFRISDTERWSTFKGDSGLMAIRLKSAEVKALPELGSTF